MKNKILSIFIALMLSLPVFVQAEDNITISDIQQPAEEQVTENILNEETTVQNLDEDTQFNENSASINQEPFEYKKPLGKKALVKKLLLALLGVIISSFMIFVLLSFYNKLRGNFINPTNRTDGEISLDVPDDLNGAIKVFLEKTKW